MSEAVVLRKNEKILEEKKEKLSELHSEDEKVELREEEKEGKEEKEIEEKHNAKFVTKERNENKVNEIKERPVSGNETSNETNKEGETNEEREKEAISPARGECYVCYAMVDNFFYFGNCGHILCVLHTIKYFGGETKPTGCMCGKSFIITNESTNPPLYEGTGREVNRAWEKYIEYSIEQQKRGNEEFTSGVRIKGSSIKERVISGMSKFVTGMESNTKEIEISDIVIKEGNIKSLLQNRISAEEMRNVGKIGIGTFVINDVNLSRLLAHDYGIKSLKIFGLKNWDQMMKLGMNSSHLRDYRTTLLPIKELKETTGMTKQDLIDLVDNACELADTGITVEELLLFDFGVEDFIVLGMQTNHFRRFGYSYPEWKKFGFTLEILDRKFRLTNVNAFIACGPWIANYEVKKYYNDKLERKMRNRYEAIGISSTPKKQRMKIRRSYHPSSDYRRKPANIKKGKLKSQLKGKTPPPSFYGGQNKHKFVL